MGTEDRARLTIPPDFSLKKSRMFGAELGMTTLADLDFNTLIGPYEGVEIRSFEEADKSGYSWQVLKLNSFIIFIYFLFVEFSKHVSITQWHRYELCMIKFYTCF